MTAQVAIYWFNQVSSSRPFLIKRHSDIPYLCTREQPLACLSSHFITACWHTGHHQQHAAVLRIDGAQCARLRRLPRACQSAHGCGQLPMRAVPVCFIFPCFPAYFFAPDTALSDCCAGDVPGRRGRGQPAGTTSSSGASSPQVCTIAWR